MRHEEPPEPANAEEAAKPRCVLTLDVTDPQDGHGLALTIRCGHCATIHDFRVHQRTHESRAPEDGDR